MRMICKEEEEEGRYVVCKKPPERRQMMAPPPQREQEHRCQIYEINHLERRSPMATDFSISMCVFYFDLCGEKVDGCQISGGVV